MKIFSRLNCFFFLFFFIPLPPPMLKTVSKNSSLWVYMNCAKTRNALSPELIGALHSVFTSADVARKKRSIVLASDKSVKGTFCSGGNLKWMSRASAQEIGKLWDMLYSIRQCPLPVIGRVTGTAAGGGAGLVAACDMAFSANNNNIHINNNNIHINNIHMNNNNNMNKKKVKPMWLGFSEVRVGLVPSMVSTFVVPKIGAANAARMFLTGERFSPKEAERMGLINKHFDTVEEMDKEIDRVCEAIRKSSKTAVSRSKKLIAEVSEITYKCESRRKMRKATTKIITEARSSPDGKEGIKAFFEKRPPYWCIKN